MWNYISLIIKYFHDTMKSSSSTLKEFFSFENSKCYIICLVKFQSIPPNTFFKNEEINLIYVLYVQLGLWRLHIRDAIIYGNPSPPPPTHTPFEDNVNETVF